MFKVVEHRLYKQALPSTPVCSQEVLEEARPTYYPSVVGGKTTGNFRHARPLPESY